MRWAAWLARASGRLARSMATKACDCTLAACACAQKRRVSQCFLQHRTPNTACWEGLGCCGSVVEVMASLGWPFHASSSLVSWFAGLLWLRASHIRQTSHFTSNGAVLCKPCLQWLLQASHMLHFAIFAASALFFVLNAFLACLAYLLVR